MLYLVSFKGLDMVYQLDVTDLVAYAKKRNFMLFPLLLFLLEKSLRFVLKKNSFLRPCYSFVDGDNVAWLNTQIMENFEDFFYNYVTDLHKFSLNPQNALPRTSSDNDDIFYVSCLEAYERDNVLPDDFSGCVISLGKLIISDNNRSLIPLSLFHLSLADDYFSVLQNLCSRYPEEMSFETQDL